MARSTERGANDDFVGSGLERCRAGTHPPGGKSLTESGASSGEACPICGSGQGIEFLAPDARAARPGATWRFLRCSRASCAVAWRVPSPSPAEFAEAYAGDYFTHSANRPPLRLPLLGRWDPFLRDAYWSARYGYGGPGATLAARVTGRVAGLRVGWRAWMDYLVFRLPAQAGGRFLEVGCGAGEALAIMRDLGWTVLGVELDPTAASVARQRGTEVITEPLESLQLPEGGFDAIGMNHVLEHVTAPKALLAEAFRILRPGGLLSVTTPNVDSLGRRVFGSSWQWLDPPRHLTLFGRKALREMLKTIGYRRVECFTGPRDANGVFRASSELGRNSRLGRPATAILGKAFQYFEAGADLLGFGLGEELVARARKPE